ncbi:MAG: AbrB/MazE/SpoVT family DNA-binding domain-containing protein [Beijerinckiaceae bacterium]|nr:AbrB/MazE/SpoVT family DNA-binding domain-containing protein [Beijerinckiaceae bacterium]
MTRTRAEMSRQDWTVTVSAGGRITLPLAVRNILGVEAGDQVRFSATPDGFMIGKVVAGAPVDPIADLADPSLEIDDWSYRET